MADEFDKTVEKLTKAVNKLSAGAKSSGGSKNIEKEREAGNETKKQTSLLKKIVDNTAGGKETKKKEGGGPNLWAMLGLAGMAASIAGLGKKGLAAID